MRKESQGELLLTKLLSEANIPFHREFKFHPTRKWRFDFVIGDFPSMLKVAVEVEGGVFSRGRHTRGHGYTNDLLKYNSALLLGWKVLRYTTAQINQNVIDDIKELVNE